MDTYHVPPGRYEIGRAEALLPAAVIQHWFDRWFPELTSTPQRVAIQGCPAFAWLETDDLDQAYVMVGILQD